MSDLETEVDYQVQLPMNIQNVLFSFQGGTLPSTICLVATHDVTPTAKTQMSLSYFCIYGKSYVATSDWLLRLPAQVNFSGPKYILSQILVTLEIIHQATSAWQRAGIR